MISDIGLQAVKGERGQPKQARKHLILVNCSRSSKRKYPEESDQRLATIEVLLIQELGTKIGQWDSVSRIQNGGGGRAKVNNVAQIFPLYVFTGFGMPRGNDTPVEQLLRACGSTRPGSSPLICVDSAVHMSHIVVHPQQSAA
jgi:hypothetical protein